MNVLKLKIEKILPLNVPLRETFPISLDIDYGYTLIEPMEELHKSELVMPYKTNADLPETVKNVLPEHAQEIYVEAFNSAWGQYDQPGERLGESSLEETVHRLAWAAVKRKYQKDEQSATWKEK